MRADTEADVNIANAEQAAAWNGEEGERWVEDADRYDRASWRTWQRFLDAGLLSPGDVVLDVGCGTGKATRDAARITAPGAVTGIDLSAPMLELARERSQADGLDNVAYLQGDAQVHPFEDGQFDVAMSSFGAMFFGDPVAAFTNIGRGVRSGGRLVLLAWRELVRNEWLMAFREALAAGRELPMPPPDAPTPFALADPERVQGILGAAGFEDVGFESLDEPIELGSNPDEAFAFAQRMGIVRGLTHDLSDDDRARALDELRSTLTAHASLEGVLLGTSAWLITARRS
jgi:SAM-dependent methyltransferase